ncbi:MULTISPECIES: HdeD family acid-resistance protein [Proteus]|uniref:HdeD family acid-resistance protein n=1 Tax=Proteus TaxID=583 RepID=UPI000BFC3207|nr:MULTISPECIES: HdeD family acid-resistance protein [Proteus]ATN00100.1 acid-resistance protein [Proteus vulgaris]MBG2836945.1 HdeD family acid-resistance protein [Proteus terrae subsp. cibarius]MBG2867960.1 HdeD family acid-resistance protein [Proteus terrae subsp. cibarius]MBJ2108589.1 HdeD family acid-resistance protein [Proteus terrae]MBJ2131384.1 HdeD family acid-resistance protein [Proteus terrae]
MLDINKNNLSQLTEKLVKRQCTLMTVIAILGFIAGFICIINPLSSGIVISVLLGVVFFASAISSIIGGFNAQVSSGWSMLITLLTGFIYLLLGYIFVTDPLKGMLSLAFFIGFLFIFAGILRLNIGFKQIKDNFYGWFNILVGFLDLVIAYFLLAFGPETSVALVMALIGIQLILSSITILSIASAIKRMTH